MEKHKNFPQLRFPGFEGEWETRKLGAVMIEGKLGGNYENSESNIGHPVIKMGNIGRGDINLNKVQYLPEEEPYNEDDILQDGDLLFNTRNTLELVGKVSIWRNELSFALFNSNLMRMKFNNQFEPTNRFLNALFNTKNSINQLRSFATGTTSVAAIYGRDLSNFKISFPSIPEQIKIASFFSVIDKKITEQKQKKTLLEQYKKGVMQKLFSQELRFKDNNGKDFQKWVTGKIGDLFYERNENGFCELELLSVSINFGVEKKSDTIKSDNSSSDKGNYKRVHENDIVYNSMRMWQGASGVSKYKGIVSPAYTVIYPKLNLNPHYFGYLFKTKKMIHTFQRKSQGLTSDTWNLKFPELSKIELSFPELGEQTKIANFLIAIDEKISHTKIQIQQTEQYKKGLLQKMFC